MRWAERPCGKCGLTLKMNVAAQALHPCGAARRKTAQSVTSDETGRFVFPGVDPGDYQMTARRDGFVSAQFGVKDGK